LSNAEFKAKFNTRTELFDEKKKFSLEDLKKLVLKE